MSLKVQIEADIKKAMLARQKDELKALRAIKSMILLAETEKGGSGDVSEDAELKLLMKAVKQRKDSAQIYKDQGREDLASTEEAEIAVIEKYLPKQLSEAEIKVELEKIIAQVGATGPQDMGKVMGMASKAMAGKADGKTISGIVKSILVG
ncbi:GatB/YqeY domain-containing protein [Roseivirga misakiensis]|uniref:Glutamyl-tRNA amidotransferase n=1 Tax=Roseivirga misakiensis TaxID=1563681 RepID=A0A1E5T648_9BACT|nr:GatB/YqeY domain-containing protein [Roseivirga misakiensis]OEK06826.1 glutamyl-tRNA amidotransferase [Roseivirga misakiensis]